MIRETEGALRPVKSYLLAGCAAIGLIVAHSGAFAQDETTPPPAEEPPVVEEQAPADATPPADGQAETASDEKIVVTGSRLKRTTFESVSPLQVVDGDTSRELGLIDTDDMLTSLSVANGTQIDTALSSNFVTDSGPGASTINLRGLDPERTLVLINGRRLAPAGVEGAPINSDLNLVPGSLIERIEVLLDGASSVYGSDAIAGVANLVLRKDFDGLEIAGYRDATLEANGGGETQQYTVTWGVNSDRGYIGVAADWYEQEALKYSDREFSKDCEHNFEYDPRTGQVRTGDARRSFGGPFYDCFTAFSTGRVFTPLGQFFLVPGTNFDLNPAFNPYGVTDFTSSGRTAGVERVPLGAGTADYQGFPDDRAGHMEPGTQRWDIFANGEYDLGIGDDITSFFELSHANRQQKVRGTAPQMFVTVPYDNPFNPFGPVGGPGLGDVTPIVSIPGDRDNVDVEVGQSRMLLGFEGTLSAFEWIGLSDWSWEVTGAYSRAVGSSERRGIIESRLALSLNTTIEDPGNPGTFICGVDYDGDGIPDEDPPIPLPGNPDLEPCVPVNLFTEDVLLRGQLTQAERDYLFGRRTFSTTYEQYIFNGTITGDLFDLPAGTVGTVFGIEYRNDELESDPDEVARTGDMVNFFADQGASGQADILEVFGEAEIPVLADMELAEELTFNVAARFTEQEFYGAAWTYSAKMNYEPTEFLKIRGTYGTSFRAPNLREFFLNGQTGFGASTIDPCVVPQAAIDPGPVYNPANDPRTAQVLAACVADGVDPTALGITGAPGVEVLTGGTTELSAETSTAWSAGFVFDQPFIDDVTMRFGVTYFNIDIENSIEEPTTGFITGSCYDQGPPLTSAFCNRITRGLDGFISQIDTSFINVGLIQSRGIDFNFLYSQDIDLFAEEFAVSLDMTATRMLENFVEILGDEDDELGEIGTPEWRGLATAIIGWEDFRFLWRTQWIGEQQEDFPNLNLAFETCPLVNPAGNSTARNPDCLANMFAKDYTDDYFLNSASFTWAPDTWQITVGVENVFDVLPEFVDPDSNYGTNGANVPPGVGYDVYGRRVFVNLSKSF